METTPARDLVCLRPGLGRCKIQVRLDGYFARKGRLRRHVIHMRRQQYGLQCTARVCRARGAGPLSRAEPHPGHQFAQSRCWRRFLVHHCKRRLIGQDCLFARMRDSGADSREPNQQSQRYQRGQSSLDSCQLCGPCLSGNCTGAADADCFGPAPYTDSIAPQGYCRRPTGSCKHADSSSSSTYRDADSGTPSSYQHTSAIASYIY